MGRIRYEPVGQLKKTVLDIIQKWPLALLIVLVDVIFLFVFSFVYNLYFQQIMGHATAIMQQTPQITSALQSQDISTAAPIAQALAKEALEINKLAFLLAVSVFVIWIAIEAVGWWISFRASGRKLKYIDCIWPFSVMSAIWTAIISAILYISIRMFFSDALAFQGSANGSILSMGMAVAFIAVGYFALVSFSLTGRIKDVLKKTVLFSFLKLRVLVAYIIIIIIAFIINFIIYFLWQLSEILGIAIGIILVLLFFVYARIYMINVVQSLEENKVKKKRKN